mmetsp:Transcript_11611/g.1728  ORF Transcript_11611/g.1728 Transcript_11611/m.1728 type:complete len:127 (+) Transcript_11611:845-1225(+)
MAYDFFEKYSGNVEVVFTDEQIYKVYFQLLPECLNLTNELKSKFDDRADRATDKTKLNYLVRRVPKMIEEMEHETRLAKIMNKYSVVAVITKHVGLWKDIAFFMTIILNFLIIASFFDSDPDCDES